MVAAAIFGLGYVVRAFVLARRQQGYKPVATDWLWHTALPVVSYLHLLFSGFALGHAADAAPYGIAVTAVVLLYIGIHNAWDAAVYIATEGR